jgi:outer membrane protein assembly factor BamA
MAGAVRWASGTLRRLLCVGVLAALGPGLPVGAAAQETAPPAPLAPAAREVIAEIRVHGNHTTPDAQVTTLAGVSPGQALEPGTLAAIERRLRASGRFDTVEVRKRYRSLDDATEVALVILVQERAAAVAGDLPLPGPLQRARRSMMFLPILDYADGYGFTYGARTTFVGALGRDGRLSVPLTWGGTKRAALEAERGFLRGPVHQLRGGVGISRRENPHYDIDDDRREVWLGATREIVRRLRGGVTTGVSDVTFGTLEDRFTTVGGDLTLDTRADPIFPRNAVLARAGWDAMALRGGPTVHRASAETRGYVALVGQSVLSARVRYDGADRPLPPYARLLLGGADTLRGHRAGAASGDRRLVSSLEVRVPLSSPLSVGRLGVSAFGDAGTVREHGERLLDGRFRAGIGAGVFLLSPFLQLSVDVAHGIDSGTRVHFSSGITF